MEEQLQDFNFIVQVHNSSILNFNGVARYVLGEGAYIVMSGNSSVKVSRSPKDSLLKFFWHILFYTGHHSIRSVTHWRLKRQYRLINFNCQSDIEQLVMIFSLSKRILTPILWQVCLSR